MITSIVAGCILSGCLQNIPIIVSDQPLRSYLVNSRKQKVDKSQFSCYIKGVFYSSCPE